MPGFQEKFRRLINHKTKVFWLILNIFSILNKKCPDLDFETKIVQIHRKINEIHYSEVEHSKF